MGEFLCVPLMRRCLTSNLLGARCFSTTPATQSSSLPGGLDHFGELCFNRNAMRKYFPNDAEKYINAIESKAHWTPELLEGFSDGVHKWAADNGCTHVTHVFQPLSGVLGEKHDIMFKVDENGGVKTSLKSSNILSSEPDASSFPNGGLRPTHQARGNCIWDPQSYMTIGKMGDACTLRIPAIFVSWTGHALQNATLKCFDAIGEKGNTRVDSHCGLEQEFFLVEEEFYNNRPDLLITGRTLIGRDASRGQDHSDRYFGFQSTRMQDCIFEMEQEFWKLGIPNSTRHREVAPGQYEMAPSFERANQANDNNLIMMQVMREVAKRHGLTVLLHEKPFANLNGSGKHNNWSFGTNKYTSFFKPENPWFNLATAAFVRGIHLHGDLLRASVATAGNDHRLGGHEAPPGIMSIFVGDEVMNNLNAAMKGEKATPAADGGVQDFHVDYMPSFRRQSADRNRTSPIAFCGNRFEFRAVGSSVNTAWSTTCLNTIQAESMEYLAKRIAEEKAGGASDPVAKVVAEVLNQHKDIIFNGDGYSDAWVTEAASRGLPNAKDSVDALARFNTDKNRKLFSSLNVLSETELNARSEVFYDNFYLDVVVELRCLVELCNSYVLPSAYKQYSIMRDCPGAGDRTKELVSLINNMNAAINECNILDDKLDNLDNVSQAQLIKKEVRPKMNQLRELSDTIEGIVANNLWTLPTYHSMIHVGH